MISFLAPGSTRNVFPAALHARNASSSITRRFASSSDPSFRYHIPRRLPCSRQLLHRTSPSKSSWITTSPSKGERCSHATHVALRSGRTQPVPPLPSRTPSNSIPPSWNHFPRSELLRRTDRYNFTLQESWSITSRAFHTSSCIRDSSTRGKAAEKSRAHNTKHASQQPNTLGEQRGQQHHFYDRLHLPQFHRPTKEELLAAATGFWSRLRIRFKWLTIKSVRPFNMDEIIGFFSWIALGHVLWLVIGTTTFVSLAILAINTVFAQETLAGWIGNYLTKSSGLKVVFESAVVPNWQGGVITFKNVFVSQRPQHHKKASVRKGSPEEAAIAAAQKGTIPEAEQNYTQFDITIGEVNVTLSFGKWWNSKGLLQNVEVKHVRGVIDRTHVHSTGEVVDPKSYRHGHNPGDFEIESFKIEDLLVTVQQPNGFRPFPVSIYNADLPRLRKQWLFYDFLGANSVTGEVDHSMFAIHPRQAHSYTGVSLNDTDATANEPWRKHSRIRIDALNVDHFNRGATGILSWIHEGNVDIVADIMIPADNDESVMKVMSDFYDRMEAELTSKVRYSDPDQASIAVTSTPTNENKRFLVMDLRIHLNDVRASVPIFTRDLSYINNALVRPIVAYINSRRMFIPINCRVLKLQEDFRGSWTVYDSGLLDDLSAEVYEAFARDVSDEQARTRRLKKVGLWSLQLAVQAIFLGLAGNMA